MVSIRLELSNEEDWIVALYKDIKRLNNKEEAIKKIISEHGCKHNNIIKKIIGGSKK
ncbi:MAG: hypothetical protein PHD81_03440 [Candidatus Nanoarchaeia archaeon]|nr:hypothetical protein [Candidatus Nanoarchaeia archaeon]MDD5588138.1 hypothetical protein [Candidatus Nanoarchaeia archaeon]